MPAHRAPSPRRHPLHARGRLAPPLGNGKKEEGRPCPCRASTRCSHVHVRAVGRTRPGATRGRHVRAAPRVPACAIAAGVRPSSCALCGCLAALDAPVLIAKALTDAIAVLSFLLWLSGSALALCLSQRFVSLSASPSLSQRSSLCLSLSLTLSLSLFLSLSSPFMARARVDGGAVAASPGAVAIPTLK